jgi:hypothetical protein
MISIKDFMECVNYRITDGGDFLWKCYGDHARTLDSETADFTISVVFDTLTQYVYEMEVWDNLMERTYRWIAPDFIKKVKKEHKDRGLKFKHCIDDRKYIDLDVEADILEKATAIANGEDYDPRVMIELNLTDAEALTLMRAAHVKDMSLNQYIGFVAETYIACLSETP